MRNLAVKIIGLLVILVGTAAAFHLLGVDLDGSVGGFVVLIPMVVWVNVADTVTEKVAAKFRENRAATQEADPPAEPDE